MPRDPADFPGNPNPPPKAPRATAPAPVAAAASETSAGTGALPPSADALESGGGSPSSPGSPSYTVSEDGVYLFDHDGAPQRVGTVTLAPDDAEKVLKASGAAHDEARGTYDGVPEAVVKSLTSGKPTLFQELKARYGAGEAELHRSALYRAAALGQISFDEARERAVPDLVKLQMEQRPAEAWKGLGDMLGRLYEHPVEEGGDILRQSVMKTAETLPAISQVLKAGGMAAAAGGTAVGLIAPPLALPAAGVAGAAGTFQALYDLETGGVAADMHDRGYHEEAVKKWAPVAGAAKAALWMYGVDAMAAPFKTSFLRGLAESAPVQKTLESWVGRYAVNAGVKMPAFVAAQSLTRDLLNNLAAMAEHRPELATSAQDFGRHAVQGAIDGAELGAVGGLPGAALEAATARTLSQEEGLPRPSQSPEGRAETGSPAPGSEPGAVAGVLPEKSTSSPSRTELGSRFERLMTGAETPEETAGKTEASTSTVPEERPSVKTFDEALARRSAGFEDVEKGQEGTPEHTQAVVERMRGEADAMRETLGLMEKQGTNPNGMQFIRDALARHEADIKVLSAGRPPEREFFMNPEIEAKPLENDKATAKDLRLQVVGDRDTQIARINQKMRAFEKAVPDEAERRAATLWVDVGGDHAKLLEGATDAKIPAEIRADYERALDLSPAALRWAQTAQRYFKEAAEVGQERGTLRSTRENYVNRLYLPEKAGDFVQGAGGASGLKRSTVHARERVFDTMLEAFQAGKKPATLDLAELVRVYNGEIARANSTRALADTMAEAGLGAWRREENIPKGWTQLGTLRRDIPLRDRKTGEPVVGEGGDQLISRSVFVVPEGLAKGLAAIAEPNYVREIDSLRGIQKYQGLVKTVDLSFSLFHHVSMLAQLAYAGDLSSLLQTRDLGRFLDAPDFAEREQEFVRHGGTTAITKDNIDILRRLTQQEGDMFSKITSLPVVKQALAATDKSADFLFGKVQRLWKVNTFSKLAAEWAAGHSTATNEEVTTAMRGIARHVNDRFGGQNWEAMGLTKSNLTLLRLGLLAPDWTISNLNLLKTAIGEGGASGKASRVHVLTALAGGMLATEGLNHLLTGHFTDENKKGHELEVEIAPDVYVSLLRGGVQDIVKLASLVRESGLGGAARFAQAKASPLVRTGVGLLSNTTYTGAPVYKRGEGPVANTYDVLKFALANGGPVPLGISNLLEYGKNGEVTPAGVAAVASGVGRYSRGPRK